MPVIEILSQICVSLSIANTFFALFFYKKYKSLLSKNFFYLVFASFLNFMFPDSTLNIIVKFFPYITGYEYVYTIGFAIAIVSVIAIIFVCRNLYFIGVEKHEKEKTKVFPLIAGSVIVLVSLFLFISNLDTLFRILYLLLMLTGVIFVLTFVAVLVRFIKAFNHIPSYIIRKASLFLIILALIGVPALYTFHLIDFTVYGRSMQLRAYIYDTINYYNIEHSLRYKLPVLIYHLFFHGASIFFIARYYFRSAEKKFKIISPEQIETYSLSSRETEVANLIIRGLKNKNIRERLFIADGTLRNHISRLYQKFQVNSREEFISFINDK